MQKMDDKSMDIVMENIEKLRVLFPDIFSEGKIDFEALKAVLGEYVEREDERYSFTWSGKARARRIAQTPSTGTLRPAPKESKNWETTQNLYIEGDNLEVLKLLQKSYHKQVKMIYIDPPYNTGKDFVYKDNFKDNIKNYLEQTGQVDSEGNKLSTNSDTSGRYHSNWLNMIYPRLKLARNLLRDDGVIFISIDDNEVANLRKVCDEIFGEENFVGTICWKKKTNGNNMGEIPPVHDYILVYTKSFNDDLLLGEKIPNEYIEKNYTNPDNDPLGPWTTSDLSANHVGPYFPIVNPKTGEEYFPPKGRYWVFNEDEVLKRIDEGKIIFGKSGNSAPVQKKYLKDRKSLRWKAESWWDKHGYNEEGTKEINELVGTKFFTHPKPSKLVKKLIDITMEDGIVLDFFSGSATTAHAVMQLNAEDGGNRRYIMVQLPEPTNEKSEAFKAGYPTIAEIGKERIRRAGEKIIEEIKGAATSVAEDNATKVASPDIGFKVFKLDSSNIKAWDPDYENLEESLLDAVDNIKPDRTEADLLYEILLKYGLDLTPPIEELELAGKTVFVVGAGSLVVCLDEEITLEVVEEIAKRKEQYEADDLMRVVFRDNGFKDAEVKTNAMQILKQVGVEDVKSV